MSRRVVTPPGLPASAWESCLSRADPLRLPPVLPGERVIVMAAHPDDETLGAAGLIQVMHRRGASIGVVICTDGAAALPGLHPRRRRELASVRQAEIRAALACLDLADTVPRFLDLPDGELADHELELTESLARLGQDYSCWIAPWRHDPHPDHQAVGRAALAATPSEATLLGYPIWMRHSMPPSHDAVHGEALRVLTLDRDQRARKQRAIRAHASQVTVWDGRYEPVLPAPVIALFQDAYEPFFLETP